MPMAITFGIIGVCFVIGWAVTYGSRPYLGLIGLAFMAGAGAQFIPAEYTLARHAVTGVAVLLLVFAFIMALADVRRRLARLREASVAREQAFFEIFQAAEAQRRQQQDAPREGSTPQEDSTPPPAGEEGTAP